MKSKSIKILLGAISFGFIFTVNAVAQAGSPPNAEVNAQGQLVLDPGGPNEQIIDPPAGTVDANGDLDVDGDGTADVTAPTAGVLADGSLDLNNNGVFDEGVDLPVPALPFPATIQWMGVAGQTPVESNADGDWYYSESLKYFFHWKNYDSETGGWFFIEEFGKNFYIFTEAERSLGTGFFAYAPLLASKGPNAASGPVEADDPERGTVANPSFVYFFPSNGVTLTVPTPESVLRAWIWFFTPHIDTGDTSAQAYFFREYEDGNKITRWGSPDFGPSIKLSGPVGWPNN